MTFEITENLLQINVDMITSLAIAGIVWLVGMSIKKRVFFLQKYCIPNPVVGGFLISLLLLVTHTLNLFEVNFDTSFQDFFMVAFFVCVGLCTNLKMFKSGGKLLIIYWLCTGFVSLTQIPIALGIGNLFGLDPSNSIMAGSISMCGGHGCATAYGNTLESLGYTQSISCGLAAATFGLISSVLIGGPIARRLIEKNNLKPDHGDLLNINTLKNKKTDKRRKLTNAEIAKNIASIFICMAIGVNLSKFASWSLTTVTGSLVNIPDYLGAMITAVIWTNLNAKFNWYKFSNRLIVGCETVTLSIFLSMAMMSIKLWELANLVGGLLCIVIVQVIFVSSFCYFILFRALGKNYNAAVMCAGLCGHGLGAVPTAMANMDAVFVKYGFTKTPTVIVSLVGGFMGDIFYQTFNIITINMLIAPIV